MKYNWTAEQIDEFVHKYPEAAQFLLRKSLLNEYNYLRTNEYILNDWEKRRFNELHKLFGRESLYH